MALFTEIANAKVSRFILDNLLQVIASTILLVLIQRWLRRKFFQNLPPGPVGLPILGYLPFLGAEPYKTLLELGKKYRSNIIGLNLGFKYTVVLNEYNVMREALSHTAALDRASDLFSHIPELGFGVMNGKGWQEQRRFSMFAMRNLGLGKGSWESSIQEEVQSLVKDLASYRGEPVEISHKLNSSIIANVIALLIGRKLDKSLEDDKIEMASEFFELSMTYSGSSNIASLVPGSRKVLEYLRISGYHRCAESIKEFGTFLKEEILSHKASKESKDSNDYIDSYMETMKQKTSRNESHFFSEGNMEGNITVLFLGAVDTIFTSLTCLFRLMARYQEVQKKVQKDLDEVIGSDGAVSYENRANIPYVFAVILESLRFSSIVPLSTTRSANADFEVAGYTIPKGTDIIGNMKAIHFDPNLWENPEEFRPERFLAEDKAKLALNLPGFVPFSLGKRNCPGETVAYMEILTFFTAVMQKFTVKPPQGEEANFEVGPGIIVHLKPQALCFVERA